MTAIKVKALCRNRRSYRMVSREVEMVSDRFAVAKSPMGWWNVYDASTGESVGHAATREMAVGIAKGVAA